MDQGPKDSVPVFHLLFQTTVPTADDVVAVLNLLDQMTSLLQMELQAESEMQSSQSNNTPSAMELARFSWVEFESLVILLEGLASGMTRDLRQLWLWVELEGGLWPAVKTMSTGGAVWRILRLSSPPPEILPLN